MRNQLKISRKAIAEVIELSKLPEDQLYAILGTQIETPRLALAFGGKGKIISDLATRAGRKWFVRYKLVLKRKICSDWSYCEKKKKFKGKDRLVEAVLPLVATAIGVSSAGAGLATTVAAILIEYGLDSFCECPKNGENKAKK